MVFRYFGMGKKKGHKKHRPKTLGKQKYEEDILEDIHEEMAHLEGAVVHQRRDMNMEAEDVKGEQFAAALRIAVKKARESERQRLGESLERAMKHQASDKLIERIKSDLESNLREEIRQEMEEEERKILRDLKKINAQLEAERTDEMVKVMEKDLHRRKKAYNRKHPKSPM